MGVGAAVRSSQARTCSSATKDSPFIHVSTKCVIALTLVLVILSGKRGSWIFFFKYPSGPTPSIQNEMVAPLPMTNVSFITLYLSTLDASEATGLCCGLPFLHRMSLHVCPGEIFIYLFFFFERNCLFGFLLAVF